MIVSSCDFSRVVFACFPSLGFSGESFSVSDVLLVQIPFKGTLTGVHKEYTHAFPGL